VYSSDLVNRGYGEDFFDFLECKNGADDWHGDIITNPPYKYALEFVRKSLEVINEESKVAMFLKLTFLEGQKRKKFFKNNPPKVVYVYSSRQMCAKNGEFEKYEGNAVAYAWFVWEKGFKGDTIVKWI